MTNHDSNDLKIKIRDLAAAFPNRIFTGSCTYACKTHKVDGTESIYGCIVGEALVALGVTLNPKWDEWGGRGFIRIIHEAGIEMKSIAHIQWIQAVQQAQDNGKTWQDAIPIADSQHFKD